MRRFACFFAALLSVFAGNDLPADEPQVSGQHVLTSAEKGIHKTTWSLTGKGWSVHKKTLHGGKQEGVDLITIDNGVLQVDVIPTRGMSIYEIRSGDMKLGWDSPVDEIVNPAYIDLESRGGLGWLEGFNEWMVRCGLEYAGHPGTDEFVTNTGDTSTMDLTLHGKIGNIPASEVSVLVDRDDASRVRLHGIVFEKSFYGPKLKLSTEISIAAGESGFRIDDSIENVGALEQEFQIIYHANFGAPLLEADARVFAAAKTLSPMNEHAAKSIDEYDVYAEPDRDFTEQVYLIEPYAAEDGTTVAVLQNSKGDRAASMTWNTSQLPYLTIWKNTAALEDGYVTGIEPATGYPFNRMTERAAGRVPKLSPGESRRFTLDISLHQNRKSVASVVKRVQAIQKGRETTVSRTPPQD